MNPIRQKVTLQIVLLLACLSTSCSAQFSNSPPGVAGDTITIRKVGGGYRYYHGGLRSLPTGKLFQVLQTNPQATSIFKKSRAPRTFATITAFSGGVLIGYQLAASILQKETSLGMAVVGVGLIGVSIPLASVGNRNVVRAVKVYNHDILRPASAAHCRELRIQATRNGIGLALGF